MSAFPAVSAEPVLQVERGSKRSERIATPARHWRRHPSPWGRRWCPSGRCEPPGASLFLWPPTSCHPGQVGVRDHILPCLHHHCPSWSFIFEGDFPSN